MASQALTDQLAVCDADKGALAQARTNEQQTAAAVAQAAQALSAAQAQDAAAKQGITDKATALDASRQKLTDLIQAEFSSVPPS